MKYSAMYLQIKKKKKIHYQCITEIPKNISFQFSIVIELSGIQLVLDALLNLRYFYVKNKRVEKQYSGSLPNAIFDSGKNSH